MFDIGMSDLIVISIVALLVFGLEKLPELGKTAGETALEIKSNLWHKRTRSQRQYLFQRRICLISF